MGKESQEEGKKGGRGARGREGGRQGPCRREEEEGPRKPVGLAARPRRPLLH